MAVAIVLGATGPSSLALGSAGGGAQVTLLRAGAETCYGFVTSPVLINGCAGFEFGRLHAKGYDVGNPRASSGTWTAGSLGTGLGWRLPKQWVLAARLSGAMLLEPFDIVLISGPGYRTGRSSVRAVLTLGRHW